MVTLQKPQYRYRIKCLGYTSRQFGPCEVCGEWVPDVWLQVEEHREFLDGRVWWGEHKSLFGHEACLLKERR